MSSGTDKKELMIAINLPILIIVSLIRNNILILNIGGGLLLTGFFLWHWIDQSYHEVGSLANFLTWGRLLLLMLIVFLFPHMSKLLVTIGLLAFIVLDKFDGIVARRLNQESDFGLLFDTEIDAFYTGIITLLHYTIGNFGIWIVAIGLLRYIYTIALSIYSKPNIEEIRRWYSVLVFVGFAIAIAIFFVFQFIISRVIVILFALLIFSSFLRDYLHRVGWANIST